VLPTDVPGGPPPTPAADAQRGHDLDDCLERLDERERQFLLLWEGAYGQLSQTEIARQWGISNSRLTEIKQSALKKLRECMEQKGYGQPAVGR
jgi:RNA polymerase sigma factor (sigma-70 family)